MDWINAFNTWGAGLCAADWWASIAWPIIWALIKIIAVVLPLMRSLFDSMGAQIYRLDANSSRP